MPGYADPDPMFKPAMRLVTGITEAANAEITTSFAHGYDTGLVVRIYVPALRFGMTQIDTLSGTITVTAPTTFTIDIDTRNFDTFTIPDPEEPFTNAFPMVVPVGQVNDSIAQATRNVS